MSAHRRLTALRCTSNLLYTAAACLNVTTGPHGWPENYFGYQPWHRLVQAADPDLPGLPLSFTLQGPDPLTAAKRALAIGRRLAADVHDRTWPPQMRRLAIGDVITITPASGTGIRRYFALGPEHHLTELPHINQPIQLTRALPAP